MKNTRRGASIRRMRPLAIALLTGTIAFGVHAQSGRTLNIHFIDVEGGQATLFVSPSGQSLLVDAGWPGGSRQAWRVIKSAPGLEDIWQLHFAVDAGAGFNAREPFLANLDETTAYGVTVSAERDGSFVVTNARNGHTRRYAAARR